MRVIVSHPHADHQSGGVRALHALRDELVVRGIPAQMSYEQPPDPARDYVVYPEVTPGNPHGAAKWCTWLLNRPAQMPGGERFAWHPMLSDDPLLCVNIIERDLWRPQGWRGSGVGVWVGKGALDPAKVPDGAAIITRASHPDRAGLADFVRGLDLLISFDPFSAMNLEAACAGVPVVVHEDSAWSQGQVRRQDWMLYGVAWGDGQDEIEWARATVGMQHTYYFEEVVPSFDALLEVFCEHVTARLMGF